VPDVEAGGRIDLEGGVLARAGTIRRRLGIPRPIPLLASAEADDRGLQIPCPPAVPTRDWPSYVAVTPDALWTSVAGTTTRFAVEDMVMASSTRGPSGTVCVDFLGGGPLVATVKDDGTLLEQLRRVLRVYDRELQMRAPRALGIPQLPPVAVAEADHARRQAEQLLATAGDDVAVRQAAERLEARAWEILHGSRVEALRELRRDLLGPRPAGAGARC
jgi:hypothetical protein